MGEEKESKAGDAPKRGIPTPPLGKWWEWVKFVWKLLKHYGLHKAAVLTLLFLFAALVIPLFSAFSLIIAGYFGDDYPNVERIRQWYVATMQDGFQVLHSRIDYVHTFELELSADRPERRVVTDIERGQHVEIVLRRV